MLLMVVLTIGFGAIITGIWALVDAFLMPGWQQREVETIRARNNRVVEDSL